jgi:superfamily I DNA/RNA helicase
VVPASFGTVPVRTPININSATSTGLFPILADAGSYAVIAYREGAEYGDSEDRSDTISVFNGPPPVIQSFSSGGEESKAVGDWIAERTKDGVLPHEFGVFVRSAAQLARAQDAVTAAGMDFKILDEHVATTSGHVSISTMHLAKGLEFRAVVVMACDDEVIPLQERIEMVSDGSDLEEVYNTERQLLYVACTRARDHLAKPKNRCRY